MLSVLVAFMVAVIEHSNENRRRKLSSQFMRQSIVVGDSRQTEPEQPTVQREQYLHASAQLTLSTLVQFRIPRLGNGVIHSKWFFLSQLPQSKHHVTGILRGLAPRLF